jgi:hypothetical protein
MSATATENSTTSSSSSRSRNRSGSQPEERAVLHFTGATEATESAVTELVHGAVQAGVSLLPTVFVRPTATVDAVFSLADQVLVATRRVAYEIASVIESGIDGAASRAA